MTGCPPSEAHSMAHALQPVQSRGILPIIRNADAVVFDGDDESLFVDVQ
jgi:hypothetical protein